MVQVLFKHCMTCLYLFKPKGRRRKRGTSNRLVAVYCWKLASMRISDLAECLIFLVGIFKMLCNGEYTLTSVFVYPFFTGRLQSELHVAYRSSWWNWIMFLRFWCPNVANCPAKWRPSPPRPCPGLLQCNNGVRNSALKPYILIVTSRACPALSRLGNVVICWVLCPCRGRKDAKSESIIP